MTRLAVRRRRALAPLDLPRTAGTIAIGLVAGTLAGFLLGEWLGPSATSALRPTRPARGPSPAELVHAAQAAMLDDDELARADLEVVPVGRGAVELHGWVPSRRARARALRLVRAAVPDSRLVDCLLVRGEDDVEADPADSAVRSA